jgi:hypothetical protein
MAFLGAIGPVGTGGSADDGGVLVTGGLGGAALAWAWALCAPGEEENLEDMLDSHEFRRVPFGDGEPVFGRLPFNVTVLSDEPLLE